MDRLNIEEIAREIRLKGEYKTTIMIEGNEYEMEFSDIDCTLSNRSYISYIIQNWGEVLVETEDQSRYKDLLEMAKIVKILEEDFADVVEEIFDKVG